MNHLNTNSAWTVIWLSLPLLGGCADYDRAGGEESGSIVAELQTPAPGCVRLTIANDVRNVVRDIETGPDASVTTKIRGLPFGTSLLTGEFWPGACGDGDPAYISEPEEVSLVLGEEPPTVVVRFRGNAGIEVTSEFEEDAELPQACEQYTNYALGADASLSDDGWAGGTAKQDTTDGSTSYCDTWAHGLAFTGGPNSWGGETCGMRQYTVNLGTAHEVSMARFYHHGLEHLPQAKLLLQGSLDGENWFEIDDEQTIRTDLATYAQGCWGATPTEHQFESITAQYIRYSFDNCGEYLADDSGSHGWLYEAEIWGCGE